MSATQSYDRAAERRLSKQLADSDVDSKDVHPGGSPAGERFRHLVRPSQRSSALRNAVQRTGNFNYLIRFGNTNQWKAVMGGKPYSGTLNQVIDQVAHLIIHYIDEA